MSLNQSDPINWVATYRQIGDIDMCKRTCETCRRGMYLTTSDVEMCNICEDQEFYEPIEDYTSEHEQDLCVARELLRKAKESGNPADAWALVDFLHDQMVLESKEEN